MISDALNSNTSAGSTEMMSSLCQAWTRVSAGVAAITAEKEVAMVATMAADRRNFGSRFMAIPLQRSKRFLLRQHECKSHKSCRVQQVVLNWQTMRRLPKGRAWTAIRVGLRG